MRLLSTTLLALCLAACSGGGNSAASRDAAPPAADAGPDADAAPAADASGTDATLQDAAPPATGSQTSSYTADDTTDFPNPERGWYVEDSFTDPKTPAPVSSVASTPTLSMRFVRLDAYQSSALPKSFLDALAKEMDGWRGTAVKAVLRFAYNRSGTGADAPIDVVLGHIQQLAPLLHDYQDVIAVLQAGFIGRWGEWHDSTHDLEFGSDKNGLYRDQIKDALVAAAPAGMMIEFRKPNFLGPADLSSSYKFGWYTALPKEANRFDGSEQSRVALHNDCFLDGSDNGGWYDAYDGTTLQQDRAIAAAVTRIVATGGETCDIGGLNASNDCQAALAEMAASNWDYLNSAYWPDIYNRWQSQGCLAEISRRLGYRFTLDRATVPRTVFAGGAMKASLSFTNKGFGKLYNARPLEIVFTGPGGPFAVTALDDARRQMPLGGASATVDLSFIAPTGLVAGQSYELHVRMPDPSSHLAADPRRMIRFADQNMWSASDGWNDLGISVKVGTP